MKNEKSAISADFLLKIIDYPGKLRQQATHQNLRFCRGPAVAKLSGPSGKGNSPSGILPEYKIPFPEGSDFPATCCRWKSGVVKVIIDSAECFLIDF
ncbi:MAG: hypothetical protein FWC51_02255 [Proteobacteria bacterium]|nr:hypothetical protein [Pseudomonadota bacterium]